MKFAYNLLKKMCHRVLPYVSKPKPSLLSIKQVESDFADWAIEKMPLDAVVLDVGCGNSRWAENWIWKGRNVVPLDAVKCNSQLVPYVRADIRKAPFRDGSIDAIRCDCTIEHIGVLGGPPPMGEREDVKAMGEMKRILKDGGILVLTTQIGKEFFDVGFSERNYSRERLNILLEGWEIVAEETFGNFGDGWNQPTWKPATWDEVTRIPETMGKRVNEWYGDVCLLLRK